MRETSAHGSQQILDDSTNLIFRDSYFESSNILVRIRGRSTSDRKALLVSAHYDSTPLSPGVTDDGIGVAVIVEVAIV